MGTFINFFKKIVKKKQIIKTIIIEQEEGLSDQEKLDNLVVGHMENGFDGMVIADIYNENNSGTTTFKVYYDDDTSKVVTVKTGSKEYDFYFQFLD